MLLYSIVVIAIIALSSIAFTYILHRHKPVDANTFIVIAFSSLFVLVLSLCFPFLFAAIINLASRTENNLRVIVGFSVILLIYILAISRFAHFIFMFLSENKNTRLQAFVDKINEAGLSNYFMHLMRLRRKPISAIGRSGAASAVFTENSGTSVVMEDIRHKEPESVYEAQQEAEQPCTDENMEFTEQQDTIPDQLEQTTDIINEAIDVINEESSLMDEEKPAVGIPEEIMQTLEEAATVDESVISDFNEYIKVASQTLDDNAETAASEICSKAEDLDDVVEFNIGQNMEDEIEVVASSQAEYQEPEEIEPESEEVLVPVNESEEIVSEAEQAVSQPTEPETETLEDNYIEINEELDLEQLETLITEEDSVIPNVESYITPEETEPEPEELTIPVNEDEEIVFEADQAVSQPTEPEAETLEDNYIEINEGPYLEQPETLITEEDSVIPNVESYITLEETESEPEELPIPVNVDEEILPESEQAVSQALEPEIETSEDNYIEINEEPDLQQLETLITEDDYIVPVEESDITQEEMQPEPDIMAVNEFETPVYEEIAPAAEAAVSVETQPSVHIETDEASVDSYIDEAFRFKQEGDYESAILYYMYALDSKPEDSLVFWVILDICVLYKEMGQIELAKQILESYVELYGNVMDTQVRDEIMRNLTEE